MQAKRDEEGKAETLPSFTCVPPIAPAYSFTLTPVTTEKGGMG